MSLAFNYRDSLVLELAIWLWVFSKPDLHIFTTENEVKRMKELYLNAEMDVVKFTANDVITTSGTTTAEWVPRENEGAPDYDAFLNI